MILYIEKKCKKKTGAVIFFGMGMPKKITEGKTVKEK